MRAKADLILGIQWGDEGKGRVVDAHATRYDVVARFGGGDNAGHSIEVGDRKLALHIVPSGALVESTELFIGGGTVVGLESLVGELEMLESIGVDTRRVRISDRAILLFPFHAALDRISERARGAEAIGTTGRGIGPAYVDRVARVGITFGDLRDLESTLEQIRHVHARHAAQLVADPAVPDIEAIVEGVRRLAPRVVPLIVDGVEYLHALLDSGRRVLIEGAQGTLLDVVYGSYPYVTSSATIAGGACTGLGIGPRDLGRVVGVAKAYCTRVGGGPFPSELDDEVGERLRAQGREFGVTTGRPRRCGWFDLVAARYAVRVNGLTSLVLTKLDVLSGFDQVGVVTDYALRGRPASLGEMNHPDLKTEILWLDGWAEEIGHIRRILDLPPAAQRYVAFLESRLGVPIEEVSVGPERSAAAR
jgi:adenylosuccinate synthase